MSGDTGSRRPTPLCRSWLFVNGAEDDALVRAPQSGADVLIQELEDFTPPELRPKARALAPETLAAWRAAGFVTAVRVNPLDGDGKADLEAVMRGAPDIIALPKVDDASQISRLDAAIWAQEEANGLAGGSTELLPNVESARGLVRLAEILAASPRVKSCLIASEDLAADLGAVRARDGLELAYARQRFVVECVAAGVLAIDCPYTWEDDAGARADTAYARRLGYRAKSAVAHAHARTINDVLTPSPAEIAEAQRIVMTFDTARAAGQARVELDGNLLEVPTYTNARRLLARAGELAALMRP